MEDRYQRYIEKGKYPEGKPLSYNDYCLKYFNCDVQPKKTSTWSNNINSLFGKNRFVDHSYLWCNPDVHNNWYESMSSDLYNLI